jgi:hypothetical protein
LVIARSPNHERTTSVDPARRAHGVDPAGIAGDVRRLADRVGATTGVAVAADRAPRRLVLLCSRLLHRAAESGKYVGSERNSGLRWANPFYSKKVVTLRVRNFESGRLKVNDLEGSPIEIAAVVVWQVHDAAEAVFNVDDYENFVQVQSEAALRQTATSYPYDLQEEHKIALRSHSQEINDHLRGEVQARLAQAGLTVIEARVSHLAYAPEVAHAMLQRQQAAAIIAARTRIVEGAVSMVHMALEQLAEKGVVHLDEERKAAMVSNLLVVLCGERGTQPIVNTGTLYSG